MNGREKPLKEPAREATRQDEGLKLWIVLSRAAAAVEAHARADVARHGLTLAEFGILEALYHKGPMLLRDVQRRILVSSGGITYLVDRLTEKGLVTRRPCEEDRRASYAALTDEGEMLIRRVFPEHARAIDRACSALSGPERREAIELLRKLGRGAASLPPPSESEA